MASDSFHAKVNQEFEFSNLDHTGLDLVKTGPDSFHILHNHTAYQAEVLRQDLQEKKFLIRINGSKYEVELSDSLDQLVRSLGLYAQTATFEKEVKAPMPGLVLEVKVREGDAVEKGQPLLILEAMKMENVIKAPADGQVKKVHIKKGQAVEKNQTMIDMD